MKKTFGKAVYDTETAEVVRKCTCGYYGDPAGYEEILFRTPGGAYFAYGRGGENSPYVEEKLTRVAKNKVQEWLDTHQ